MTITVNKQRWKHRFLCIAWIMLLLTWLIVGSTRVFADTIEISEIPLGGVIAINGRKFIKVSLDGDFIAADVFCPKGMTFDAQYGACVKVYGCSQVSGTMQTWDGCAALATPTGTNYTQGPCLMDERDHKTYQVRKFADGKCWMVDNLAYGGTDLNPDGSDGCMKLSMCGYGLLPDGTCERNNGNLAGPAEGLIAPGLYGDCRYTYNSLSTPDTNKYGYLYNWQAATQDPSAYYNNDYQPAEPVQGLCPDGWALPMQSEFATLHTVTGSLSTGFWQPGKSWNGIYAGNCGYNGGSVTNQGSMAWWWSATQINGNNAYTTRITTSATNTSNSSPKGNGFSIRCVKQ